MSIKARRGTNAQRLTVTFEDGEICWTTDTNKLYMGDGVTAGGIEIGAATEANDLTAAVVWADIPDANVPQSAVTQHEAALDHDALTNFVAAEHIDWSVTGVEDVHVDRIAAGAVTQHQAALSITESQISDLTHTDASAIHDNVAGEINALTEKLSPVNADLIIIEDSADTNNKKKVQVGNLPGGGGGASELSDLTDVNTSTPTNRNVLVADGVDFESRALVEADISDLGTYLTTVQDSDVDTEAALDGQVLTSDGAGNAAWETPASGVTDHTLLSNIGTNTHAQIDTHIADSTVHFTQASISITESQISDLGAYLTSVQDGNVDSEASLDGQVLTSDGAGNAAWETPASGVTDHLLLSNIGTNSHAQIDTHIADSTIHSTASTAETLTNKTIDGDSNTLSNLDIGNEVDWAAAADVTDRTAFASGDKLIIHEAGVGLRKIDYDDLPGVGGGISNVVEDTTPQLGGNLDINGNDIVSTANGNIDIIPNGTGNVNLGNFSFDVDQTVGAGQDNYVLTYDNGSGLISLEVAAGGGGGLNNIVEDVTPQLGGDLDTNGNDVIFGTGDDIVGDFSNATRVNRTKIITSTANSFTVLPISPNGTGTGSYLSMNAESDIDNTPFLALGSEPAVGYLNSTSVGTGVTQPMELRSGGTTGLRLNTDLSVEVDGEIASFSGNDLVLAPGGTAALTFDGSTQSATFSGSTYPITRINRNGTADIVWTSAEIKATKSTNMSDGFGAGFNFSIEDNAGVNNVIGKVKAVRAGADNTGDITFSGYASGAEVEGLVVKSDASVEAKGPIVFPSYTVAGVPTASSYTGGMIYVSNETGGATMAFSDGTNWRRVQDRAIIA